MDSAKESLNYEFKYYMFLVKSNLRNVKKHNDRERFLRWMQKLSSGCQNNVDEMRVRNELLHYLVSSIQEKQMRPPFDDDPPTGPIASLGALLTRPSCKEPGAAPSCPEKCHASQGADPYIYQFSPDGGAFLCAQPVPRCGAFCYLAVVSRGKN